MPIVGLDCEWVTQNEIRHPVALLQIADKDGMCFLIRLSKFKTIPSSLSVNTIPLNQQYILLYFIYYFLISEHFEQF